MLENQIPKVKITEYTSGQIPDPTVRAYIFGRETLNRSAIINAYISNMNNILLMSFFAIFVVWKEHSEDESRFEDEYVAACPAAIHAKRVNEVMQSIY